MRLIEKVWYGRSPSDVVLRAALAPLATIFRGVVAIREQLYDRGMLDAKASSIKVLSVGNLTVGGTGKTPVSGWLARKLVEIGMSPAIVLRGYGEDEPLVHRRINERIPVFVAADRVVGIAAAAGSGADVAVLDDGFQHRKASRDLDFVLVSADNWSRVKRVLPAGPYREPLSALSRASAVIITRKSAADARVADVIHGVRQAAGPVPTAVVRLELDKVIPVTHSAGALPVDVIGGKSLTAIAAVGNPRAFFKQLEAKGAIVRPVEFPDHHAFTAVDVARILDLATGCDYIICTLKDAVKLEHLWPAGSAPLWYVSLAVHIESGEAEIDELLMRLKGRIDVD